MVRKIGTGMLVAVAAGGLLSLVGCGGGNDSETGPTFEGDGALDFFFGSDFLSTTVAQGGVNQIDRFIEPGTDLYDFNIGATFGGLRYLNIEVFNFDGTADFNVPITLTDRPVREIAPPELDPACLRRSSSAPP